ncbi:MAG: Hsp70 family protein [Sumerlaeia bacterium]
MTTPEIVVGIDLGTTNSSVAALMNGNVTVLGSKDTALLPSVVGLTPGGELLIGEAARNQQLVHPERTIRSIKRRMGENVKVPLGDQQYSPPEISALILKELANWAAQKLGAPPRKAVITVPAYFSDAQRQATREAGELAGLEVLRILNEPTAASFAYGYGLEDAERHTVMIYDLGGGTFDVSIVTIEGDITEVLASHGDNQLGGDDFDQLLLERLVQLFREQNGLQITREAHPIAWSRLWWAAEEAKKKLSTETWTTVREEALVTKDGTPLHLEASISREDYEAMIRPLIDKTLESVTAALRDAQLEPGAIDATLLVGGSTRTPLVWNKLEAALGKPPRQDVHPDLCVALGAGVLAARHAGHDVQKVLVDVTPYSFGVSHLGERGGLPYAYCYRPTIRRNTPIPVTRAESYFTVHDGQEAVEVQVFQGDSPDALQNIPVGKFLIEGLRDVPAPNEVLCRMSLDLNGILRVSAIEKQTGHAAHITIEGALTPKSEEEIAKARRRLDELFAPRQGEWPALSQPSAENELEDSAPLPGEDPAFATPRQKAERLLAKSREALDTMHPDDKEEAIGFNEEVQNAIAKQDLTALQEAMATLEDLLFYVEGHR